MSIDEMIAVMQHYRDGGEVECKERNGFDTWYTIKKPIWNFSNSDYRIKETPKTKTVWFWKVRLATDWYMPEYMYTEEEIKKDWTNALEHKRMDILGSEEVPNV